MKQILEKPAWLKKPPLDAQKNKPKTANGKLIGGPQSTIPGEVTRNTTVKVGNWRRQKRIQKP